MKLRAKDNRSCYGTLSDLLGCERAYEGYFERDLPRHLTITIPDSMPSDRKGKILEKLGEQGYEVEVLQP